jgi:hypothetical protein
VLVVVVGVPEHGCLLCPHQCLVQLPADVANGEAELGAAWPGRGADVEARTGFEHTASAEENACESNIGRPAPSSLAIVSASAVLPTYSIPYGGSVHSTDATVPCITSETCPLSVASPHSRRCGPSSYSCPGVESGSSSGNAGASSGSLAGFSVPRMRSRSPLEKPVRASSTPSAVSSASSSARAGSSHSPQMLLSRSAHVRARSHSSST